MKLAGLGATKKLKKFAKEVVKQHLEYETEKIAE